MSVSTELIVPGFLMGLAGSLHCIGMCGPLALSLPVPYKNNFARVGGGSIYNTGRILSYSLLGVIFGTIGNFVMAARWQSVLSIVLGVLILIYLLFPKKWFHLSLTNSFSKPFNFLRQRLGILFQSKRLSSLFFIGILNGFLPCGLVYLGLTSSVISASPLNGGLFMLFFGLGTFPMMFTVVFMGNYLNHSLRQKLHSIVPALLFCMAVLLILRGMNLGIPFISPEINSERQTQIIECH